MASGSRSRGSSWWLRSLDFTAPRIGLHGHREHSQVTETKTHQGGHRYTEAKRHGNTTTRRRTRHEQQQQATTARRLERAVGLHPCITKGRSRRRGHGSGWSKVRTTDRGEPVGEARRDGPVEELDVARAEAGAEEQEGGGGARPRGTERTTPEVGGGGARRGAARAATGAVQVEDGPAGKRGMRRGAPEGVHREATCT